MSAYCVSGFMLNIGNTDESSVVLMVVGLASQILGYSFGALYYLLFQE